MPQYLKALMAFAVAVLSVIVAQLTDGRITPAEWVVIAIGFVNAFNVWLVPNLPTGIGTAAKALVVVANAILAVLSDQILGGLNASGVVLLTIVALQALAVYLAPNAPAPARIAA